jgi:cytochrome P450 family 110
MDTQTTSRFKHPPRMHQSSFSQTMNWIIDPLQQMENGRQVLGDVFTVRVLGWANLVLIGNPELVRQAFAAAPTLLAAGKANDLMGPVIGSDSVFLLDGSRHREIRRTIVNSLKVETSRSAAQFAGDRLLSLAREKCDGDLQDVHRIFADVALATMLKLLFGASEPRMCREYSNEFYLLLGGLSSYLAYLRSLQVDFGFGSPGWWIRSRARRLHELVERDIARSLGTFAKEQSGSKPIASILATAWSQHDRKLLRDQIISLIVAGHDTVASALSWAVFWLLKTPDALHSLLDELHSANSFAEIERAPFLEAVCLEALRLVPTVEIVSRYATDDFQLGSYCITKGDFVSPSIYLLHRNEDLYPSAKSFRPSRFIGRQFAGHEFIPFGGGLRRCVGATLGLLEMKTVLHALLRNFDIETHNLSKVKAKRRNVTIAPSSNFRLRLTHRHN